MNKTINTDEISALYMDDIMAIDFSMVKLKIQDKEEGAGWTVSQSNEAEEEYKKFLALKRTYPEKEIVPNKIVDLFWHQHILDTQKYAEDCANVFGYFLHHFPYFGMRDEQDMRNLTDAFDETNRLYSLHFDKKFDHPAEAYAMQRCRTQCKPVKCR